MADQKNVERVARCRAKQKRVELLFKPKEYERISTSAEVGGETVSGYIKEAVRMRMEMETQQNQTGG